MDIKIDFTDKEKEFQEAIYLLLKDLKDSEIYSCEQNEQIVCSNCPFRQGADDCKIGILMYAMEDFCETIIQLNKKGENK